MPRALVTPHLLYEQPGPYRDVLTAAGFEVVYPPGAKSLMEPQVLAEHLAGIDAVLAGMEPFSREVLAGSKLRAIARVGVGYDAIDVDAATELGIPIAITPGTNEVSVAEHTIALLTGVMRGFPGREREVRTGQWLRRPAPRIAGKTLGLIGLGRIGKAVVPRAQGLGLKVIASDPFPDETFAAQNNVELVSLDRLLAEADIVSLHLPASVETNDLINAATLAKMKRGAVLINTSRGNLVDEQALYEALASGHLYAAGLDVFKQEPLPLDSPLLTLGNVLVAPHMGGLDDASLEAMSRMAAQCVADLYQGRWPEGCIVNDSLREGWHW